MNACVQVSINNTPGFNFYCRPGMVELWIAEGYGGIRIKQFLYSGLFFEQT